MRTTQVSGTLSGGEQQMLAIGAARLMGEPGASFLLDEPSLGLAPRIIETIFDAVSRDQRGRARPS